MDVAGIGSGAQTPGNPVSKKTTPTQKSTEHWKSELQKAAQSSRNTANTSLLSTESSSELTEIMSRYDLSNISPREIDTLVDELLKTGDVEFGALALVVTLGERFQTHMTNTLGGDTSTLDPMRRYDLPGSVAEQRSFAAKRGTPLEWYDKALALFDKLTEARQQGEATSSRTRMMQTVLQLQSL